MKGQGSGALRRLERERDLYRRLLDLGAVESPATFLEEALSILVEISGARRGYLELRDPVDPERIFPLGRGFSGEELTEVRRRISGGIIGRALSTGETVHTPSALLDPRFQANESVREHAIAAVLCVPIGTGPPLGVVYLERDGEGGFPDADRALVEACARAVQPLASGLLRTAAGREADPAEPWRRRLGAMRWVGRSTVLAELLRQVAHLAPLDVTVFLTGPSGTGKSALARLLHENGGRRTAPFMEVNCAAIPPDLAESELFGAERGAHSTATERRMGRIEAADGGTLFLDEVTELPAPVQAKLLQFLQDGTYFPLGSPTSRRADVRVLAASNVDPRAAVEARRFRADLYWRLMVVPLAVPSLAERREDIPALLALFCDDASARHRLGTFEIDDATIGAAAAAPWEGNVRELAHAAEAAVVRAAAEGARRIESRHLVARSTPVSGGAPRPWQEVAGAHRREVLITSLERHRWNVAKTARSLGLSRSRIYELLNAYGIERR